MWIKENAGAYVNLDCVAYLYWVNDAGNYEMWAKFVGDSPSAVQLSGSWSSSSEVTEAINELVNGVDPSNYGD